jgi:hypothetical protein
MSMSTDMAFGRRLFLFRGGICSTEHFCTDGDENIRTLMNLGGEERISGSCDSTLASCASILGW